MSGGAAPAVATYVALGLPAIQPWISVVLPNPGPATTVMSRRPSTLANRSSSARRGSAAGRVGSATAFDPDSGSSPGPAGVPARSATMPLVPGLTDDSVCRTAAGAV